MTCTKLHNSARRRGSAHIVITLKLTHFVIYIPSGILTKTKDMVPKFRTLPLSRWFNYSTILLLFVSGPLGASTTFELASFAVLADTTSLTSFGKLSYSDDQEVGKGFGLSVGRDFGDKWRIELQWLFSDSTAEGTVDGIGFPLNVNQQLEANGGFANVLREFKPGGPDSSWSLFLSAGIGMIHMQNTAVITSIADTLRASDTDTGRAWQVEVKNVYSFNDQWKTGLSLRYLECADFSFQSQGISQVLANTRVLLIGPFVQLNF